VSDLEGANTVDQVWFRKSDGSEVAVFPEGSTIPAVSFAGTGSNGLVGVESGEDWTGEWTVVTWSELGGNGISEIARWTEVCAPEETPVWLNPQTEAKTTGSLIAFNAVARSDLEGPCGPDDEAELRHFVFAKQPGGSGPLRVISDSAYFFDVDGNDVYIVEDWLSRRTEYQPDWEIVRVTLEGESTVVARGEYANRHYAIGALAVCEGSIAWQMNHMATDETADRADAQIFVQRPNGNRYVIQENDRGMMNRLWMSERLVAWSGNSEYEIDTDLADPETEPRDSFEYVADLDAGMVWRLASCPGCGFMDVAGDLVLWTEDPQRDANGVAPPGVRQRLARFASAE
jgi:hypothetical protein